MKLTSKTTTSSPGGIQTTLAAILFAAAPTLSAVPNTWVGETDAFWAIADGKANWANINSTEFLNGDDAIFDETGIAQNAVILAPGATLAPNTITFRNISAPYLFDDSTADEETLSAEGGILVSEDVTQDVTINAKITGETRITHSGTGTLSLGGGVVNNDFVGGIQVDGGGTLRNLRAIDNVNSLGDFGNSFRFSNGSTFDLNSIGLHRDYQEYGTGSFVFGEGTTLTNTSGSTSNDTFDDELVFAGDVTLAGVGRFDLTGPFEVTGNNIVITMENEAGNVINGDNSDQSIAEWVVNDGVLIVSNPLSLGNDAFVSINPGGAIRGNVPAATDIIIPNDISVNGGRLESGFARGSNTFYTGNIRVTDLGGVSIPDGSGAIARLGREISLQGTLSGSGDLTIDSGITILDSDLDLTGFTGDYILTRTGLTAAALQFSDGAIAPQDITVSDVGGPKEIRVVTGNSATLAGRILVNEVGPEAFRFFVGSEDDTITVRGNISGPGGVAKIQPGNLVYQGINTYAGDTVINGGNLTIETGSQLNFFPTTDGVNNQITGNETGSLDYDGELFIDLSGVDTTAGNSWTLVDSSALIADYGGTFAVNSSSGAFMNNGSGIWTLTDGAGNEFTFSQATGILSLPGGDSAFAIWLAQFTTLSGDDLLPEADPDGDSISNFGEFAFDGNPEDSSNNGRFCSFTEDTAGNELLILTIAVRNDTADFTAGTPATASSVVDGIDYAIEGSLILSSFAQGVSILAPVQDTGLAPLSAGYKWQSFSLDGSTDFPDVGFLRGSATQAP